MIITQQEGRTVGIWADEGGGRKEGREGKERGKGKNIRPERSGEEIN